MAARSIALLLAVASFAAAAGGPPRLETVPLELRSGRTLEAQVRRPATADAPLPAVMLFGGFRGAARVMEAVPDELPLVAASFDYPFDAPRRFRFPQSFGDLLAVKRGIDDSFEGIARLAAHLRARPDVDPQRITIIGASFGAPFAVSSAAELELPGLVVVHGFGDLRRVIAHQFIRKLEPRYGRWVRAPAWGLANALVWGLDLPSPERDAARLRPTQRGLMTVALDDERIPAQGTEALWQGLLASQARVERQDHHGAHLRGIEDARIDAVVATALDWMARERLR